MPLRLDNGGWGIGGILFLLLTTTTQAFLQPITPRQHAAAFLSNTQPPPAFLGATIADVRRTTKRSRLFSTRTFHPPTETTAYFYQVLGVTRDATVQQIKTAYRALAKEFHPDANRHNTLEDTTVLFQNVNRAYEVVLEEVRNREEAEEHQRTTPQQQPPPSQPYQQQYAHPYYNAAPPPAPARNWSPTTNRYAKRPTTNHQYQQYSSYGRTEQPPRRDQRPPSNEQHFHRYGSSYAPPEPPQAPPQQQQRYYNPQNTARGGSSHQRSWNAAEAPEQPRYYSPTTSHHRSWNGATEDDVAQPPMSSPVQPNFVNVHPTRGATQDPNRRRPQAGRGATYSQQGQRHHRPRPPTDASYTRPDMPQQPPQQQQQEWKVDFDVQTERRPVRRGIMERIFHRRGRRQQQPSQQQHFGGTVPADQHGAPPSVVVGQDLSVDVWIDRPTAIRGGVQTVHVSHQQDGEEIVRHITVTIPPTEGSLPTGHMFYVASQGHPSPHQQGPPGDLYIFLRVRDG